MHDTAALMSEIKRNKLEITSLRQWDSIKIRGNIGLCIIEGPARQDSCQACQPCHSYWIWPVTRTQISPVKITGYIDFLFLFVSACEDMYKVVCAEVCTGAVRALGKSGTWGHTGTDGLTIVSWLLCTLSGTGVSCALKFKRLLLSDKKNQHCALIFNSSCLLLQLTSCVVEDPVVCMSARQCTYTVSGYSVIEALKIPCKCAKLQMLCLLTTLQISCNNK